MKTNSLEYTERDVLILMTKFSEQNGRIEFSYKPFGSNGLNLRIYLVDSTNHIVSYLDEQTGLSLRNETEC